LLDVEVADVAQPEARPVVAQDEERRRRALRLLSRQLPRLKPETMFLRGRPQL
jgi:hypothetical protein